MKCSILSGDLKIEFHEDGSSSSTAILSSSYNTLPLWLKLAQDNCCEAERANARVRNEWLTDGVDQKRLLLDEFRPAMLAIVACAIAIDGLYDLARPFAKVDETTTRAWRENKTARSKQISEVFRRAFKLDAEETQRCRKLVEEISALRDQAVHPSHKMKRTVKRPDLPVATDWRFAAYCDSNSHAAFVNTLKMVYELADRCSSNTDLKKQMCSLVKSLKENGIEEQGSRAARNQGA